MRRKGFAIILVLAILMLLALLSLTYIKLALIDRNIARNYMDNKRAKLIAQSGVDYAIARIQEDIFDTSWQEAKTITINGKVETYTENAGSTYGPDRDIFKVEVRDCNSMINVNDGLGNARVTDNTKRILNTLGDVSGIATLGDKIINNRPPQGYTSKQELLKAISATELETIKDLVTAHAWQDPNVANPVPLSSNVINAYPVLYNTGLQTSLGTQNVYRYGRGYSRSEALITTPLVFAPDFANGDSLAHGIYGLDELNPQWIEIVSRSPVNINTAPREVLIALLKDLRGFFVSDRRRNFPKSGSTYSIYNDIYFDYAPGGTTGDEYGFLYTTQQISTLAGTIADKIMNYRASTPFKTWRQFNKFCDSLVPGILNETRTISGKIIFYEYCLDPGSYFDTPVTSEVARRQASQAMADCLKANFNPNLHLNELNPDANIKTLVDKTDLIINSTEFCFTPMGYFEIESEGMILKDDKIIAQSKINALVKLFDATRYTNEKQFLGGTLVEDSPYTNNEKTLEIGPEPAYVNNQAASENAWGGYIALATMNGPDSMGGAGVTLTFRAHYSTNHFKADYHADGASYYANVTTKNVPDSTEKTAGIRGPYPYDLSYRLARSFRKESDINQFRAPCDLRIDGAYEERYAGLAYAMPWSSLSSSTTKVFQTQGMVSYWIKPSFYPETAGKPRTFFSLSGQSSMSDPKIFAHYFLPTHRSSVANEDKYVGYGLDPNICYGYRSTSLLFGYSTYWSSTDFGNDFGGIGESTPVLNHLSHFGNPCYTEKPSYLKSGQWMHVICAWTFPPPKVLDPPPQDPSESVFEPYCQIWANGVKDSTNNRWCSVVGHPSGIISKNHLLYIIKYFRIGEPINASGEFGAIYRNWTSDSTVDEFYIFSGFNPSIINSLFYARSRYYRLDWSASNETSYVSGPLALTNRDKIIPSYSNILSPSTSGQASSISIPATKILGISWTYYGEDTDTDGNAIIRDYKIFESATDLRARVKVSILKRIGASQEEYGPFDQDGYSSATVQIDPMAEYRYKVTFKIEYDAANPATSAVLLYSPIFDDITIYYTQGIQFVSYHSE